MSLLHGRRAEQVAENYLLDSGLKLITKNFYCRSGEIDLIMQDNDELVFVEVRARKSADYGSGAETVDFRKQKKIISCAKFFLKTNNWTKDLNCRFDVVEIQQDASEKINWMKDAFTLENQFSIL